MASLNVVEFSELVCLQAVVTTRAGMRLWGNDWFDWLIQRLPVAITLESGFHPVYPEFLLRRLETSSAPSVTRLIIF